MQRICKSIGRNSLHNRTHLMHIIASSEPQVFRLDVPQGNIGGTSVVAVGNDMSNKDVNNHFLKGVTIDSLNLPIDSPVVMKIDAEGHELEVLLGCKYCVCKYGTSLKPVHGPKVESLSPSQIASSSSRFYPMLIELIDRGEAAWTSAHLSGVAGELVRAVDAVASAIGGGVGDRRRRRSGRCDVDRILAGSTHCRRRLRRIRN